MHGCDQVFFFFLKAKVGGEGVDAGLVPFDKVPCGV